MSEEATTQKPKKVSAHTVIWPHVRERIIRPALESAIADLKREDKPVSSRTIHEKIVAYFSNPEIGVAQINVSTVSDWLKDCGYKFERTTTFIAPPAPAPAVA